MRRARWIGCILTLAVTIAPAAEPTSEAHWASWRGPLQTGVAPAADPPLRWSETENVRFKVALPGPGHATPVVWGDRIYVLAAIRTDKRVVPAPAPPAPEERSSLLPGALPEIVPASRAAAQVRPRSPRDRRKGRSGRPRPEPPTHVHRFVVLALDRHTGETLWQTTVREEVPHEPGHVTASQASASPVTDGAHVWVSFGSRGIYALDRDGKVVWERDLGDMRTRNQFGEGSSPVLAGDTILLNWDHEGDSFLVALDKRTGKERWRTPRDEPTSWSTPLVVRDGKRPVAVVSATNRVRGYDVQTGQELWSCGGLGLNCAPTPVADSELVYVMSGYRDPAGMAIRYRGARGDLTGSEAVAWRIETGTSYVPSPLLYEGKLYFLERFKGMLSCHELQSGAPCYEQQRLEGLGNVYASPVGAAGRVYVVDRNGAALVFRHGPRFEVLAQSKLDDAFDASPVIVGKRLYLRGHRNLYCLEAE